MLQPEEHLPKVLWQLVFNFLDLLDQYMLHPVPHFHGACARPPIPCTIASDDGAPRTIDAGALFTEAAIRNSHRAFAELVVTFPKYRPEPRFFHAAADWGDTVVLGWVHARTPSLFSTVLATNRAAKHGRIATLQYLRALTPPACWSANTCGAAAASGQLETLQWLRSRTPPCPLGEETMTRASLSTHPRKDEVIAWLQEHEGLTILG